MEENTTTQNEKFLTHTTLYGGIANLPVCTLLVGMGNFPIDLQLNGKFCLTLNKAVEATPPPTAGSFFYLRKPTSVSHITFFSTTYTYVFGKVTGTNRLCSGIPGNWQLKSTVIFPDLDYLTLKPVPCYN